MEGKWNKNIPKWNKNIPKWKQVMGSPCVRCKCFPLVRYDDPVTLFSSCDKCIDVTGVEKHVQKRMFSHVFEPREIRMSDIKDIYYSDYELRNKPEGEHSVGFLFKEDAYSSPYVPCTREALVALMIMFGIRSANQYDSFHTSREIVPGRRISLMDGRFVVVMDDDNFVDPRNFKARAELTNALVSNVAAADEEGAHKMIYEFVAKYSQLYPGKVE